MVYEHWASPNTCSDWTIRYASLRMIYEETILRTANFEICGHHNSVSII